MTDNRFFHISPEGNLVHLADVEAALALYQAPGYIWLDYAHPTKEELSLLIEPLKIHPLSVEDCLDDEQIPKIDNFPTNTFILFNTFQYSERNLQVEELDLILGTKFLVSVSRRQLREQRFLRQLDEKLVIERDNVKQGPDFLAHFIMDLAIDHKFEAIEALQDEIDQLEEEILDKFVSFQPGKLMQLRRYLLSLRKSLFHERETLVKINRRDCPFITEKALFHFRDIYDHLTRFFEMVEIYREMITNLMEIYLSLINNQMSKVANRTNRVMRRLTFITTIFMPLTLLAGIGGMSEWSMMTGPENWKVSYTLFLLGMVVIGVINYYLLTWIDQRTEKKALEQELADD